MAEQAVKLRGEVGLGRWVGCLEDDASAERFGADFGRVGRFGHEAADFFVETPNPSAARKKSSAPKPRDAAVAMQIALHRWSPPRIADFLRTRSTMVPAIGEKIP